VSVGAATGAGVTTATAASVYNCGKKSSDEDFREFHVFSSRTKPAGPGELIEIREA
jgi:hypothetical protein